MSANWNRYDMRSTNRGVSSSRAQRRVGMDYSGMTSGTAALLPTPKPVLTPYRMGQGIMIYRSGRALAARITRIEHNPWLGAQFTIVCGSENAVLTRAGLDALTAPPKVDPNIPLLLAKLPERVYVSEQPRVYTTFYVDFSRPVAPRIIYAPAPKQTSAAIA